MNAYELADDVKNISNTIEALEWVQKASPLLRQQADRIAELEKKCKCYDDTYRLPTDKQSAEPFIWLKQDFDGEWIEVHPNKGIPLYTTPQIKELSDEEIKKCVIAWVKQIYGNEYVTPLDSHIIKGTKLIRLAEKRIFKNDSL